MDKKSTSGVAKPKTDKDMNMPVHTDYRSFQQTRSTANSGYQEVDRLVTAEITTRSAQLIPLEIRKLERLLEIEKTIKKSLTKPFQHHAMMAALSAISLAIIIFEINELLANFSLSDNVERKKVIGTGNNVGLFSIGNIVMLSMITVTYAISTAKYTTEGLPDELIGEVSALAHEDVHGWNRGRMLALVNTLIDQHEKNSQQHHKNSAANEVSETFFSLENIRMKLESKIIFREKVISYGIRALRIFGFIALGDGVIENYGNEDFRARALLAYLVSGMSFDIAFLARLLSYYVPSTQQILNDEEVQLIKLILADGAIHETSAEHAVHIIRRHSIRFYSPGVSATPTPGAVALEEKEEVKIEEKKQSRRLTV